MLTSPRWLLDNDHDEEGMVVIANLYGGGDIHNAEAREEYREIKMNVLLQRQEGERTYAEMFRKYRTRVFIAMSAQGLAQLNGINVISYYAPYVFESAGWVGHDAVLMTGLNGITYFLSTIPPWYLVDRWGRRMILLSGAVAMAISLSLISYFIFLDIRWTPRLVVLFVMIYNAAFGYSWGPIPWLYPPEILPLSIRSKGASLSTATNWAANWLVGEMTPILQEWIKWRLYLVHAFFCVLSFVIGKSAARQWDDEAVADSFAQCTLFTPRLAESVSRTWTQYSAMLAPSSAPRPSAPKPGPLSEADRPLDLDAERWARQVEFLDFTLGQTRKSTMTTSRRRSQVVGKIVASVGGFPGSLAAAQAAPAAAKDVMRPSGSRRRAAATPTAE